MNKDKAKEFGIAIVTGLGAGGTALAVEPSWWSILIGVVTSVITKVAIKITK